MLSSAAVTMKASGNGLRPSTATSSGSPWTAASSFSACSRGTKRSRETRGSRLMVAANAVESARLASRKTEICGCTVTRPATTRRLSSSA